MNSFEFSDGWILLAIRTSGTDDGGAQLVDVIGAADFINHAIPTQEEIEKEAE